MHFYLLFNVLINDYLHNSSFRTESQIIFFSDHMDLTLWGVMVVFYFFIIKLIFLVTEKLGKLKKTTNHS